MQAVFVAFHREPRLDMRQNVHDFYCRIRPALSCKTPEGSLAGRIMKSTANNEEAKVTIASDLLQRHIQTLVADNAQWQTLIADDILWELAYAPSIGHPAQLSGREEAVRHAIWFVGAVEKFRFFELKVYALADPERAVAEVKGEGLIKSTRRMYCQDYVLFLRAAGGKIAFLREYFDPVRAARALDTPILGLES